MAVGLKVFNDNNVVQIDDSYRNYVLVQKGTGASPSMIDRATDLYIQSDEQLLVVVRSDSGATIVQNGKRNGVWHYIVNTWNPMETFYWYAFGKNYPTPQDQFGLRVFNASGELMYHSALKPLSIVAAVSRILPISSLEIDATPVQQLPDHPTWIPESITVPLKAGRTYAALALSVGSITIRYKQNNTATSDIYVYTPRNTGSGLILDAAKWFTMPGQNPVYKGQYGWSTVRRQYNEMFYWIIDITGL
ncbi:hypothetical protein N5853_11080 [Bartonella sp. HY329]|uniref:hypothetical protein n=1 Tax=unclassified Bartonella TaxID=2645622 RepID=UPI0021C72B7C|nr:MULTISPECIES: hypothetical protein [unclassified Bartonella]UXM94635.1 hypothetical protein N5853_11080 [Bartonella sp. HY329]UXN08958.1 hypothetical protein N5852_11090 [Bartonella sp. HY328]